MPPRTRKATPGAASAEQAASGASNPIAEAMAKLRPTAATAGDPEAAAAAVQGVLDAREPQTVKEATDQIIEKVRADRDATKERARQAASDPAVEPPMVTPGELLAIAQEESEVGARVYPAAPPPLNAPTVAELSTGATLSHESRPLEPADRIRAALFPQRAELVVTKFLPGASIAVQNLRGDNEEYLTDKPERRPVRPEEWADLIEPAELLFDEQAAWKFAPGSRWHAELGIAPNQATAILLRRDIEQVIA